ncbi:MAG: hypothetical protein ACTHMV_13445 [Chitinophagaceae bacterium]
MSYKKIKTYEDACKVLKKDPAKLPDYSQAELASAEEKFNLAAFKLARIYQALNMVKGKLWNPKINDNKYYPWMWHEEDKSKPSGVGLSYFVYVGQCSTTFVAARLCGRTSEIAEYAFKHFQDLYEDLICFRV